MSHYSVLVIQDKNSPDIDTMLAPYDENMEMEPYIYKTKDELIVEARHMREWALERQANGETIDKYCEPYLNAETDEELYAIIRDIEYRDYDEEGNELATYNPESKWDWYVVGGRWSGALKDKMGDCINEGYAGELDFSPDMEEYNYALRFWEVVVDGDELKSNETEDMYRNYYKVEYYENRYKNKEEYAKSCSDFGTFAVITPDGEWHEKGHMGWFGCSSETDEEAMNWDRSYYELFLRNLDPDDYLTIVDCHI